MMNLLNIAASWNLRVSESTKLPRLIKGGQEKSQRHSKQDDVSPVIPKHTVAIIRVNDKLETH